MRRFLDWTAAQTGAGQLSANNRRNSQQGQGQHQAPFMQSQPSNPTRDLEIQHLTKLLHEIKYYQASSSPLPTPAGTQNQRDFVDKVQKTLPLFLNVFGHGSLPSTGSVFTLAESSCQSSVDQPEILHSDSTSSSSKPNSPLPPLQSPHMERFPDLLPFAFTIARLFVSEVRQRASNKHAEDASLGILQFLNYKPVQEQVVEGAEEQVSTPVVTTQAGKKSINEVKEDDENSKQANDGNPIPEVVSGPLIKAFTQLLVQLCSYQAAIDELIKKDDLRLLIGIASSQCSQYCKPWRRTASQTLLAISKNMRDNFMYLDQNMCIQVYVENMHRIHSLGLSTTDEFIDKIRTLVEFLYNLDVNNRNQARSIAPLVEQFKTSRIVDLIEELIYKIDDTIVNECRTPTPGLDSNNSHHSFSQQPSISSEIGSCIDEYRRYGRRLFQSLIIMAKINASQESITNVLTLKPLTTSRFEMLENFKMPKPSARNCILNLDALRLLKVAWSKCLDGHMTEAILDATISLFNDDKYNYFIYESQQLLVYYLTSNNFNILPYKVKQKLFKFLEFIIIETNYIPCLELGTLGTIIKKKSSPDADLIMGLKTLIACLKFNSKFSDIFREIGLLEVVVDSLIQTMQQDQLYQGTDKLEVLYLLFETSQHLLAGPNNLNCTRFNESGAARYVSNCLSKPAFFRLFISPNCSSSDDGGLAPASSRNNTPSFSFSSKSNSLNQAISHHHNQALESHSSMKPSIKQLQKVAFTIIRQLILSSAGDEHLANLLGLLARNIDDLRSIEMADNVPAVSDDGDCLKATNATNELSLDVLLNQEVNLKICILKSLMIILRDSHRCRTLFRKAGGFLYIVSALATLEHSLVSHIRMDEKVTETHNTWKKVAARRVWRLIKNSLMTVVVAMRQEPANLRTFSDDVNDKFVESLRKLGCFALDSEILNSSISVQHIDEQNDNYTAYRSIFLAPPTRDFSTLASDNIRPSEACCQLLRFLYDMSLDMVDGTGELEAELDRPNLNRYGHQNSHGTKSMSFDQGTSKSNEESGVFKRRSQLNTAPRRPPSLDLNMKNIEPAILTFPCLVLTILDLIPSCPSANLMIFVTSVVKTLFKHERNQQMLCEAGMISKLLGSTWRLCITDKKHFLHELAEFMLEKLTRQSITAKELRMFLRLDQPLRCKNLDEIEVTESYDETRQKLSESSKESTSVPTTRVKEKILTSRIDALVAMMTNERYKQQPPFLEFDMSSEGFSSIFMPSIAPINAKTLAANGNSFLNSTLDVHTNEKNGILGGVGTSERQFPPVNGLSFSTWICIEKFPSRASEATHNLRLLTIYRGSAETGKEYSCFRVQISALDRALTVSTQETTLFDSDSRSDAQFDPDYNLSIWTPDLLFEGKWHHIAITMNRSLMKQSTIQVYVDGKMVHSQRICYISNYVGSTNSCPLGNSSSNSNATSAAAFVNAFIGSLPQFRIQQRTQWKQGPCHLIEDCLGPSFVNVIYGLGPDFIGNFQSTFKLNELAKAKGYQQVHLDSRFNYQHEAQHGKPLYHQQSVAVPSNQHPAPLTRVSSSGTTSSSPGQPQSSSFNQYSVTEDRILISIDARAQSLMTLSRMRRIYTRFDCRQVSRVLGLALHENSTPILLLHNTGVHLNGPSRGIGAITIGHNHIRCFVPSPTQQTLNNLGGCYILLGFIAQAHDVDSFQTSLRALVCALKANTCLQAQMDAINGYQTLAVFFCKKKNLLNNQILKLTFALITNYARNPDNEIDPTTLIIQQTGALRELICECFDLWLQTGMINQVLEFIYDLINSTNNETSRNVASTSSTVRTKNLKCLRDMDLLPRMLRLLPKYDSQHIDPAFLKAPIKDYLEDTITEPESTQAFDTKAVYLIRQTVFELLNRTPRQSDILYFGQFLASLLPCKSKERPAHTVNLRNILLKSLLQMMTKNKQKEVNFAMQEELVRILGFDWFLLFISGSHLDSETITVGFLNLMIVLSNEELYLNFKSKTSFNNGCWLKEPVFPTMDGKFNIQLLGINVGVFFGLSGKRKAIRQEVLESPNLFLLSCCLTNLVELPRIYLMMFLTMMGGLNRLDSSVMDTIESFDKMNLDILCDSLMGDNHHKRRKTLSSLQFKCHELVVCMIYMLRDIMCKPESMQINQDESTTNDEAKQFQNFPVDVVRFLMYLYNNNQEFQQFCRRSDELMDALSESLMKPKDLALKTEDKWNKEMTQHAAAKEILELSRLIILDTMTDPSGETTIIEQLHSFERFIEALSACLEAQGGLVDMLLRQILLMIDSTARHNSIKTIGSSENVMQFQLLLTNSITVSQIVTDKIWLKELYHDNLNQVHSIIDHLLCLAEQIFKFNELLPKNSPPHAFVMQRVLNRILLFALSRPLNHISDKLLMLDLLKKIHDNRTIIILNHMHSAQSAEFFVCTAYCLMKLIEENTSSPARTVKTQQSVASDKPPSMIERQFKNSRSITDSTVAGPSSTALMLVSMARKVWDSIYQSKKGILSEALDVPLSLPAFTLETSLDLLQLKPDINETCERYWSNFIESEQKPKKRLVQRQSEPVSSASTSTAVHMLSHRLTRVVNAASFVSRVVGATAGTMASNVNLVGEKLTQNRVMKRDFSRQSTDTFSTLSPSLSNPPQGGLSPQVGGLTSSESIGQFKSAKITPQELGDAFRAHISIIEDYIEAQLSQKNHKLVLHKYLCDEWLDIEYEMLLRERAVFGPDYGSQLEKWCLDMTEGPRRMRKKMVNNTRQFYDNYPYRPAQYNPSNKSLRYRPPMSYDSHQYYMKTVDLDHHLLELSDRASTDKVFATISMSDEAEPATTSSNTLTSSPDKAKVQIINVDCPSPVKSIRESHSSIESLPSPSGMRLTAEPSSPRPSEGDPDDGDSTSFVDFSPEIEAETNSARNSENIDSLSVLRLLEKNERISHMFRCSRVQGLDTYEGILLFGREHFYLIDGFTLLKTREIKDIDSLPPDAHDPIIPNSTPNILAHSKKTCAKFSFDSVVEVHKRRYLLQPIALEVFSSDGRNTLIVFPRNIRNKVYSRLMAVSTQLTNNAHESLAGQKSNVSVEGGSGLLSNLIGETSVTQRWVRGELSNFQYLMNLNTIAGRSYNDLMQYPIFPWILADYTSDYLDLSKPCSFRDLSRPVGAQTSERLEQFKRRYAEWDDTETPPYHYGTFYSSAMIVASYMVRMEPFTQHFLRLQGGHFDLADRMFHSINDSWLSASKHNMADIKELVPEFFYLPEFLKNQNKYDLGIKQSGMKLDDVLLPPWAKNDTREFIRLHRCALESDYVSAHLHEWIDLIFGYKQQGQAAVEAVNVFHHLFYEGNVDIYNTDIDPIKKNAVIGFINNFGQVPKQLFKKPHPVRKVTGYSGPQTPLTPMLPSLSSGSGGQSSQRVLTHCPHLLRPINSNFKDLKGPVGQIVQIDKNIVAVEQNKLLIPAEYCRYIAWGHADRSLRLGLYDSEKPIFVWEGSENMAPIEVLCCTIPSSRTMITGGTDSLLTVWKIEKMKFLTPIMNLYGHVEPVTCLASSQSYSLIVSGSRDRTAIIWDLNRFTFVRQLGGGPSDKLTHRGPISAIAINDSTGDIATCASSWLYLWSINGELLAQVDSLSVVIQQSMCINSSITSNIGQLHILSVCFSQYNEWDLDEVIVTGASDGSVALWSMRYYQAPQTKAEMEEAKAKLEELSQIEQEQAKDGEAEQEESKDVEPTRSEAVIASDPIEIRGPRQRTDTMNSEWVKLSTSSTSGETIPVQRATPTSINLDQTSEVGAQNNDQPCSGESYGGEPSGFLNDKDMNSYQPAPSLTPVSTCDLGEFDSAKDFSINTQNAGHADAASSTGNLSITCDDIDGQSMSKNNLLLTPNDPSVIKFSKSDTSLVESFVILGDTGGGHNQASKKNHMSKEQRRPQSSAGTDRGRRRLTHRDHDRPSPRNAAKLLPNHCWRRELFLRATLPRRSKSIPAAVTSLTISKDHKTLFIGDASGKITSWVTN